jgi:NADPH:quinone reductase-like Zn-dependent oxidoreductase
MSTSAIVISKYGPPSVLEERTIPPPTPTSGEVTIRVKAFGLNHAESHMRKGEWDESDPVPGIEAVGIVEAAPGGEVPVGATVMAIMGGMGRTRPGSYAEVVNVPASNVVAVDTTLPWASLAAIPEVYSVAWTCLFSILDLRPGETLLLRGATSTLGTAALKLAANAGAIVTATSRSTAKHPLLLSQGAKHVLREEPSLQAGTFDKTLNLVGNSVLVESINLTRPGGRMLQAGWLGGLGAIEFNPMLQLESGVHFSLFHSKTLGGPHFPLAAVPMQEMVRKIERGEIEAAPARVFHAKDIVEAHELLDAGTAGGKIVVTRD